jgi:hypothetical protein
VLNLLIGWADPRCDANDGCDVRNFVIRTKEERERLCEIEKREAYDVG